MDGPSFCSIVLCVVFQKSVVSASATNKCCASLLNPLCLVWSVEGHFTVKSQAAISFRGGLREASGSDGPVKLVHPFQTAVRPVVPNNFLVFPPKDFPISFYIVPYLII